MNFAKSSFHGNSDKKRILQNTKWGLEKPKFICHILQCLQNSPTTEVSWIRQPLSHELEPLVKTRHPYLWNPHLWTRVRVLTGTGAGYSGKPQGSPWQYHPFHLFILFLVSLFVEESPRHRDFMVFLQFRNVLLRYIRWVYLNYLGHRRCLILPYLVIVVIEHTCSML